MQHFGWGAKVANANASSCFGVEENHLGREKGGLWKCNSEWSCGKCFKAIRAGTNYLFVSSRGDAKTTFLFR